MKAKWLITGDDNFFDRLRDLMWHIEIAYTPKERIEYLNNEIIIRTVNDESEGKYILKVDNDGHYRKHKI